ncbi:hypothetical protein Ddye_008022 [Dipteronia dyeriana]|uniref:Small auxin up regulated protein n=1 Tax=Dipteronia dyeriana TaxID=168575 RepID=A0AAE0CKX1_9ROSI|nr:hypothetical protein Ddye_008022 [Dipteronia dyeriana]
MDDHDEVAATMVPDDVNEGHFVVVAVKGEETQSFVVELGYLKNPKFLRLLEQAEEEYGFKQNGALTLPCRPDELQKILQGRCEITGAGVQVINSGIIASY